LVKSILFLPKYTRKGASSRLRTFQFLPYWEKAGVTFKVAPFFNDKYLEQIYAYKTPGIWNVLFCYFRRSIIFFTVWRFDQVWIEKEIFPYFPAWAEWILKISGKGYFVDYDDAVFHNYDQNSFFLVKFLMGKKIDKVMALADIVFVGNPYIADRAQLAGAKRLVFVPTCIDFLKYQIRGPVNKGATCVIGWVGTPSTYKYLKAILPVLEKLNNQHNFILRIISGKQPVDFNGNYELKIWTEDSEVADIYQLDIGIMPLPDDSFEKGKCAYKLIQYMACGLPVVASPVGFNTTVVTHGLNGYLADTPEAWQIHLTDLILHPEKRQSMGTQGYLRVQESYTLEKNIERIREGLGW
jgi:glycosyltransferase involved in cell wall biosynthesis